MLSASDGRWESLEGLLSCEPALLCKRDFITGFTVLHWAAKHGRQELLATLVNFAQRHQLPVDINARTSGGHTALHIAAMHGHAEVVKLLVGAYDADVDIRDYSGRKAAQYLHQGTSGDMRSLVGALEEEEEEEGAAGNGSGRWRLSKVLPSNLMSYRLHHHHHSTGEEAEESRSPTYICHFKLSSLQALLRFQKVPSYANTPAFRLHCSLPAKLSTEKKTMQHYESCRRITDSYSQGTDSFELHNSKAQLTYISSQGVCLQRKTGPVKLPRRGYSLEENLMTYCSAKRSQIPMPRQYTCVSPYFQQHYNHVKAKLVIWLIPVSSLPGEMSAARKNAGASPDDDPQINDLNQFRFQQILLHVLKDLK
ncbi:hypothetical protein Q9966_011786 [Columba livia]|nr:hypothetical protein Q9966_011786 [Columba livia]